MVSERVAKWFDVSGRVVVLTGATGRLGRYYADVLSEGGAHVVLIDLNQAACEQVADELAKRYGTRALGLAVDISRKPDVFAAVETVVAQFRRVDVLINNAAAQQLTVFDGDVCSVEEFPLEVWDANLDVNLTGALLCCQAIGRQMVQQGGGVILNIGSVYGVVACDQRIYGNSRINSSIAYATTKSGLLNFTRYLASYWQGKNIRVNCLSPGGVFNNQNPEFLENYVYRTMLKRMASLDDLGSAVLYLVSDASSWVTGTNLVVDGGFTAW
jgi:NAD(P)-dependent dehydrogenase (short-subunit alcohol dehydrogenase family)